MNLDTLTAVLRRYSKLGEFTYSAPPDEGPVLTLTGGNLEGGGLQ